MKTINNLEENCLENIFQYLPLKDKFRCRRVCKKWRSLINPILKKQNTFALFDKLYPIQTGEDSCKNHKVNPVDIVLSKNFEWKSGNLNKMLNQLPNMKHVSIRLLEKEHLEKMTDELVDALESLECLEIPYSSVVLKFVDKFSPTLKYIECCYFNKCETLMDLLMSCENLNYLYMIGCPEFTSDILKIASPKLNYVYTMERILFSNFDDKFPNKNYPKNLKGIGFVTAKDLPLVISTFPNLIELLVEFHNGYYPLMDIVKLTNLENLYIREYNRKKPFDENLLFIFKHCSQLKSLNLQNVNVSDASLSKILEYCPKFEKLYINNIQMGHFATNLITDNTIKSFMNGKSIQSINIKGPNEVSSEFNKPKLRGKYKVFEVFATVN